MYVFKHPLELRENILNLNTGSICLSNLQFYCVLIQWTLTGGALGSSGCRFCHQVVLNTSEGAVPNDGDSASTYQECGTTPSEVFSAT